MENHAIAVVNKNPARRLRGAVARGHWRKLILEQQASRKSWWAGAAGAAIWAPSWFAWRCVLDEEVVDMFPAPPLPGSILEQHIRERSPPDCVFSDSAFGK